MTTHPTLPLAALAADAYAKAGAGAFTHDLRGLMGAPIGALGAGVETPGPSVAWLAAALDAMPPGELADLVRDSAGRVPWIIGGARMPASFAGRSAYIEIAGPDGVVPSERLRFGLFTQAPKSFYPPHNHEAEEHYYVLSGEALWQKGGSPFAAMPPGSCIRHAPWQSHAMRTGPAPLLAMWVWTGALGMESYRIQA